MSTLDKAIRIVATEFEGSYDKGGQPYILHCLHVMNQMDPNDHELRTIAVLHDLLEDRPETWSVERLIREGFSQRVVQAVLTLTHNKDNCSYDDYIKQVTMSDDTRKVKRADLRHNSDITRMKGLRKKDFERLEKYHRAYEYLKEQ